MQIANNWQIAKNMRNIFPHPYTDADADAWLKELELWNPLTNFAITVDHQFAGGIGLTLHGTFTFDRRRFGYWLGRESWGRGIATAAVRGFSRATVLRRTICLHLCVRVFIESGFDCVLEKAGYVREGVLREKRGEKGGRCWTSVVYAMTDCDMLAVARLAFHYRPPLWRFQWSCLRLSNFLWLLASAFSLANSSLCRG